MVTVDCLIELEYPDEKQAEIVLMAIEQDNTTYASAELRGSKIIINASAESEVSMLHTLEDLLPCLKIAEEIIGRVKD